MSRRKKPPENKEVGTDIPAVPPIESDPVPVGDDPWTDSVLVKLLSQSPAECLKSLSTVDRRTPEEIERERPFNQPAADADFDHWLLFKDWTADALTALLLEKDPRRVQWSEVEHLVEVSPFARIFAEQRAVVIDNFKHLLPRPPAAAASREALLFAIVMRDGGTSIHIPVQEALEWAASRGVDIPDGLRAAAKKRGIPVNDLRAENGELRKQIEELTIRVHELENVPRIDEAQQQRIRELEAENDRLSRVAASVLRTQDLAKMELAPNARPTALKLVIGLAHLSYKYDPKKGRSDVPRTISDDLAEIGIDVSDDTIRTYLADAREIWDGPPDE